MDPTIANANLSPPRQRVFARGMLPALLAHVLLVVALSANVNWKRTPDPSKVVAVPGVNVPASQDPATATAQVPPVTTPIASTSVAAPDAAPAPSAGVEPGTPAESSGRTAMGAPAAPSPAPSAGAAAPRRVQPSFDCAKARSDPEKIICADPELARLDRELGQLHARAMAAAPNPAAFKRQSDAEWRAREALCRDRECLLAWYAHRRGQLEAALAPSRAR